MQGHRKYGFAFLAVLAILGPTVAHADDLYNKKTVKQHETPLPKPAEVKALMPQPPSVALKGQDDSAQLVISAQLDGKLQDLTADVQYEIADTKIARVTSAGRIIPLANGSTTVTAATATRPRR